MKLTSKRSRRDRTEDLGSMPCEKMKPYQLIEKLFEDRPNDTYASQKELSAEINRYFSDRRSEITQPDVSKAFKRYEMYADINGEKRLIYQINGTIKLFDPGDSYETLIIALAKLNPFASERVLCPMPNTFAFKLNTEKTEGREDDLKEIFFKCYGTDVIFSIVIIDELMLIILDAEDTPDVAERMPGIPKAVAERIESKSKKNKDNDA